MSDLPPSPPPQPPSGPPDYKVYRSRRRLRDRLGPAGSSPLDALRKRRDRGPKQPRVPGEKGPKPVWRRVLKWALIAILLWALVAVASFFISAQTAPGVSDRTKEALSPGGAVLTGSTVLVLGSDERPKGTKEPGANKGSARADSILLLRVGVGSVRKLSIPRDTRVDIPGHGPNKINAAFAFGGAALTIRTIERFFDDEDLRINHIVIVDFANFEKLIDALGGVDITLKGCVHSNSFGGKRVRLGRGEHHLDGEEALRFARVRKNRCSPNEDDRARAARQQQVFAGLRDRVVSPLNWPSTFVRGPFVAWEAPRAIRSDMHGPGLSALFIDLLTGGAGDTAVLEPDPAQPFIGGDLNVTEVQRSEALDKFLGR